MDATIYKSEENRILLTDEFLVFDKDKPIYFEHLLVIKMSKDNKHAYCLIGQYKPGYFFTALRIKEDDLIRDLLKVKNLKIVEKNTVETPGKWGRYGEIQFDDDLSLVWYTAQGAKWIYVKQGKSMKNRIGYKYLPLTFFKRKFDYVSDNRKVVEEWKKSDDIVLYDPFQEDSLERHFESVAQFKESNPNYVPRSNETFGPKPKNQFWVGCLTFIVIVFISMIITLIMA